MNNVKSRENNRPLNMLKSSKWIKDENVNVEEFPEVETLEIEDSTYDDYISKFSRISKSTVCKTKKKQKKSIKLKENKPFKDDNKHVKPKKTENVWLNYGVPKVIANNLIENGFEKPTQIQQKCITEMLQLKKDVVVAAETGSGKTLLYILPMLSKCLEIRAYSNTTQNTKLRCLIITPTRELSVQVKNMYSQISGGLSVFCSEIIGGMSDIKQERILSKRPEIVVGTPGRLWTYFEDLPHDHFQDISGFKLLVVDEVDRMTEKGHFRELAKISDFLRSKNSNFIVYVLSATISLKSLGFDDPRNPISKILKLKDPAFFNLTNLKLTPATLEEYKIFSSEKHLNTYLYLLLKKSLKTIVFVLNIKTCQWLHMLLSSMNIPTLMLNSRMDQKNRLKLFDKFGKNKGVLLATDVAARGLDFPDVDLIIHYGVPSTSDTYVHRSGRSARQSKHGTSILMVTSDQISHYNKILQHLGRSDDFPEYQTDFQDFLKLRELVEAFSKFTDKCFKLQKLESNNRWFKEKSESCETIIDTDFVKNYQKNEETIQCLKKEVKNEKKKLASNLVQVNSYLS